MSERYIGEEGMISACMQAKNDSIALATQLPSDPSSKSANLSYLCATPSGWSNNVQSKRLVLSHENHGMQTTSSIVIEGGDSGQLVDNSKIAWQHPSSF